MLFYECIEGLQIKPNGIYVDGTIGGAGHSVEILAQLNANGLLIGIDRDEEAITAAKLRLADFSYFSNRTYQLVQDRHENIKDILEKLDILAVDGFLLDLGVSSHQLDTAERGFSYRFDANLDMRMDKHWNVSAYDVVNGYDEKELARIIKEYGEERYSKRIARALCLTRLKSPIVSTLQLSDVIASAVPKSFGSFGHPAARTFQAIRIEVNGELNKLAQTIEDMVNLLKPGGRICVISFHSLEDRIVKHSFKYWADPCDCPKNIPYCVCGKVPKIKLVSRKPIRPGDTELQDNSRSHSAKLRIAEKIDCGDFNCNRP